MDAKIYPSKLKGTINSAPYKSMAIRAIICASLSNAPTEFCLRSETSDITSTINCLNKLGADISGYGEKLTVCPIDFEKELDAVDEFDVGDSVATFKFLLPTISILLGGGAFIGKCKLPKKTTAEYLYSLSGVGFTGDKLPLKANGRLKGGKIKVSKNIGSQAISGILLALPLLNTDTEVTIVDQVSPSYLVDLTLSVMKDFGVNVIKKGNSYFVGANERYSSPTTYTVEGDYTFASYFLCAGEFGGGVSVNGLKDNTLQPDKEIVNLLKSLKESNDCTLSLNNVSDLIYPIVALACYKKGITEIKDAKRKSEKSSEKFSAFISSLNKMGANIEETDDGVKVYGTGKIKGGVFVDSFDDVKTAMALAIVASNADEPTYLLSLDVVMKSYPSFFNDFVRLGGKCEAK